MGVSLKLLLSLSSVRKYLVESHILQFEFSAHGLNIVLCVKPLGMQSVAVEKNTDGMCLAIYLFGLLYTYVLM